MPVDSRFLAEQAERLSVALRPPRRSLDTALTELGMLLNGLCETDQQAERLTTALLAQVWPRGFDFALVSSRARQLAQPKAARTPREIFLEWGTAAEADGLIEYGRRRGLHAAVKAEDFTTLWSEAVEDADTWADSAEAAPFLDYFRRWWVERFKGIYPRTAQEPFLSRNARQRVSIARYDHIVKGKPMPNPMQPIVPSTKVPPADSVSAGEVLELRISVDQLAQKMAVPKGREKPPEL